MQSIEEQLRIIKSIIGSGKDIKIKEDGFMSRGFVVNEGELVFKFPRNRDVKYEDEIENLNFINSLNLGVNLQKIAYLGDNNQYLGIYGVLGNSLEEKCFSESERKSIGKQLGFAIKKLHNTNHRTKEICSLKDDITAWQQRFLSVTNFINETFTEKEQAVINELMLKWAPKQLENLGEKLVYSHGDLGDGNVFVDKNCKVGIIDFSESCLLDEGADFMDLQDDIICNAMLDEYCANEILRQKVFIRRLIRPIIVLKPYLDRGDKTQINNLVKLIRDKICIYNSLVKRGEKYDNKDFI